MRESLLFMSSMNETSSDKLESNLLRLIDLTRELQVDDSESRLKSPINSWGVKNSDSPENEDTMDSSSKL